ncbi:MAG: DNA repair protein RadA, partial [Candidatus Omnitrophica bacterium]|nr:DNA repair protein RadA [Candidatus Omnitrophota bacterium]
GHIVTRLNEAEKLGFKKCIVPANNLKARTDLKLKTLKTVPVGTLKEALDFIRSS